MDKFPDHFDGKRFHNLDRTKRPNWWQTLKWFLTRRWPSWPRWIETQPGEKPPAQVKGTAIRVTFINHAAVLLQLEGRNILIDPVYSGYTGPFSWGMPKRVKIPGIRFVDLPAIDTVLLSHNHYDHMDLATLRRLAQNHQPQFIVPLANARHLHKVGITEIDEMDWWQRMPLSPSLELSCVPAQHWSRRGLFDENKSLWSGYVLHGRNAGQVYCAGDTGMGPHFAEIRRRLGAMRLSLLPIGAYLPRWFMKPQHMSPDEAATAHQIISSQTSVAIHFGTFPLADDAYQQPAEELRKMLREKGIAEEAFWILTEGEGREIG